MKANIVNGTEQEVVLKTQSGPGGLVAKQKTLEPGEHYTCEVDSNTYREYLITFPSPRPSLDANTSETIVVTSYELWEGTGSDFTIKRGAETSNQPSRYVIERTPRKPQSIYSRLLKRMNPVGPDQPGNSQNSSSHLKFFM